MNFKKMLSICKRSKAYFLYDLPDGEQMLSNGSCGYILYGHPEYTPETLRMVVKSGLIVQGVIRTMDLSKAEAVCRDLINLGTVAGMAIEERNNEE